MKEEKGQVAMEYILVVGAVLIMALAGMPMILKNAEMNKAMGAARDGATKAAAMRGMGFSTTGGNEAGNVKIWNLTSEFNSSVGSKQRYLIRLYVDIPSNLPSASVCNVIRRQALSHINYSFYGGWSDNLGDIEGSYYIFNVGCKDIT